MKVFVTKYALTEGIQEMEVEVRSPTMVRAGACLYFHGEGNEWHRTIESAKNRAEIMRMKKLSSHHKSIKKLSAMVF